MAEESTTERDSEAAAETEADGDFGFPTNTSVEEMNVDQRANYWRHQAQKHERMLKSERRERGGLRADEIATLREKAKRADELDLELGTTADKAAAKAAEDAKNSTRDEYLPDVISARLDAAAARAGVSEDDLTKALKFVDTSKFVGTDDKVDTEMVKDFVATLAPAKGNQQDRSQQQRGPSSRGQGGGTRTTATGSTVASGRDLWNERNPTRAVTTGS